MILCENDTVAKRKPKDAEAKDRIDIRGEPEWIQRVLRQAARLGLSTSGYIRLAVTERLEKDESSDPLMKK